MASSNLSFTITTRVSPRNSLIGRSPKWAFKASIVAKLFVAIFSTSGNYRRCRWNKRHAAVQRQFLQGPLCLLPRGNLELRAFDRAFALNLVLQVNDRLNHLLRSRRTAGNVNVDGNKAID